MLTLKIRFYTTALFLAVLAISCSPQKEKAQEETPEEETTMEEPAEAPATATADIGPASGSNVTGQATFTEENGAVKMVVDLSGISPGTHAIHLHEKGDCSAEDASSAGGHWNPTGAQHGHIGDTEEFHYGDIGNFEAGEDSTAHIETTIDIWTIGGDETSNILGKGVIVHAGEDDYTSQPSGAAGARIACGVLQ